MNIVQVNIADAQIVMDNVLQVLKLLLCNGSDGSLTQEVVFVILMAAHEEFIWQRRYGGDRGNNGPREGEHDVESSVCCIHRKS